MGLTNQGFEVSWETLFQKMRWRGIEDKVLLPPHACTCTLMHTCTHSGTHLHSTYTLHTQVNK